VACCQRHKLLASWRICAASSSTSPRKVAPAHRAQSQKCANDQPLSDIWRPGFTSYQARFVQMTHKTVISSRRGGSHNGVLEFNPRGAVVGITICVVIGYIVFLQPNPDSNVPDLPPSDAMVETPPDETSSTSLSLNPSSTLCTILCDFSRPYGLSRRHRSVTFPHDPPEIRLAAENDALPVTVRRLTVTGHFLV
jgi:hypothetical protein